MLNDINHIVDDISFFQAFKDLDIKLEKTLWPKFYVNQITMKIK